MSNGSVCLECRRDGRNPLSSDEIRTCLLNHQDLGKKLLFRAGGLKTTERFPSATSRDLELSDQARKQRISQLDVPTFGPNKVIHSSLIGMDSIPPIAITVRKFQPVEGDRLGKSWVDAEGRLRELELQPYAIADVRQYAAQFATYLRDNYMGWAESEGGPYTIVAALIQSEVPASHQELYQQLLLFIFAALHKTQTAYLADGSETLGTEAIHEQGHRLDGKRIVPRMILAQEDPLNTLSILIPSQKALLEQLIQLLATDDALNWGPCVTSIAALCTMGAAMFADRRRHGQENDFKGRYSVPEFVAETAGALMILIAKFHNFEQRCGREAGLQSCDSLITDYFYQLHIATLKKVDDDEIEVPEWWLRQLVADPKTWVPLPTPSESEVDGQSIQA